MKIEAGLLRVFRGYAFLRLALGALVLGAEIYLPERGRFGGGVERESALVTAVVIALMLALVGYLYAAGLQKRLGKFYIPLALVLATLSLFLEQYLLTPRAIIWQTDSFFFILLILVAWQYDMAAVLIFSVGVAVADYGLNLALRPTLFFLSSFAPPQPGGSVFFGRADVMVFFGRQLGRLLAFVVLGFHHHQPGECAA